MINDVLHDIFSFWRDLFILYLILKPFMEYETHLLPLDNPQKSKFPFQSLCQV